MGTCARSAWDYAVEQFHQFPVPRSGVTTAHILLGVLHEETCAGGLLLGKLGLDFKLAYATTEFALRYGRRREGNEAPPVEWGGVLHTPAARTAMDYCFEEANLFSPTYPIGTEHLALAVARVSDGMGCRLLNYFGIDVFRIRGARDTLWDVLKTVE
jgi:hypothetical protein